MNRLPRIEFYEADFFVSADIGTFIEAVFVESYYVLNKNTGEVVTNVIPKETLADLKDLAIIKFKELR